MYKKLPTHKEERIKRANEQAALLAEELSTIEGVQRLGDEAYAEVLRQEAGRSI